MSNQNCGVNNDAIMPTTTIGIDSVLEKAVRVGVPVALYALVVKVSGKRGACAVTHALKVFGYGKMKYGVASLFAISQVSEEAAHMAVKIPSKLSLKQRLKDGEEKSSVLRSVDQLPVSGDMKQELKKYVHTYCKKREEHVDSMPDEDFAEDCAEIDRDVQNSEYYIPPECVACAEEFPERKDICPRFDDYQKERWYT